MKLSRTVSITIGVSVGGALFLAAVAVSISASRRDPAPPPSELVVEEDAEPQSPESQSPEPQSFIAMRSAFDDFRSWDRDRVEGAMLPVGVEPGPTYIYANRPPPRGQARWPVGTVLVKVIEADDIAGWTIHAMVKRGLPFNPEGTAGWEFFELSYSEGDELTILWRGEGPPSGHGYAAMGVDAGPDPIPLVCNDCHAPAWQNDGVLTPALALH